ncbi:serine hydrolase [candidate division KSB1 bacterium]
MHKIYNKPMIVFLIVLLLNITALAQSHDVQENEKSGKIDDLISTYHEYGLFNGVVLAAEGGKIILKKGYGLANREWDMPHSPDTKFRIASITKPFTALLIMQLVEKGKIDLNGKITDYLPYYRKDTGEKVTIHHLLSHSSGIPDYLRIPGFWQNQLLLRFSRRDFIDQFCTGDLEFEPGTKYKYSNSGYYILGMIIENVTKQPLEAVLNENILSPLKMNNTGLETNRKMLKKRAIGYTKSGFDYINVPYLNIENIYASGQMYSTVEDLYLLDQALYSDKLLSEEYRSKLFEPCYYYPRGKYYVGYDWEIGKYSLSAGRDSIAYARHFGGLNGFNTLFCRLMEDKHLIVLFCNLDSAPLRDMSIKITNILYGCSYELPKKSIALELVEIINEEGVKSGVKRYFLLKQTQPDKLDFNERELNKLGYYILRQNRIKEAVKIFELNVEVFPEYANGWDSLGEAYFMQGDRQMAIDCYNKVLELNPNSSNAIEMLKKIRNNK